MGWETRRGGGRYYYRYRWDRGRVTKVYVGKGPAAVQAAREDEEKRADRIAQRQVVELERVLEKSPQDMMADLDGQVRIAIHTALMAAGFHQHARGRWRKRRVKTTQAANESDNRK